MTSPLLDNHRRRYQRQADQVRQRLTDAERQQLANPALSHAQRRRNIRHLRQLATSQLAQLHRQYQESLPGLMRSLINPLLKLDDFPLSDLSWRDAMRTVGEITDQDQAMQLWRVSVMAGDHMLIKALAYHAHPNPESDAPPRWPRILMAWGEYNPAAARVMEQVNDIWQETNSKDAPFEASTMFRLPPEQQPDPPASDRERGNDALPQLPPPQAV